MGMFDYVAVETPCPYCGTMCSDFQTKDGDCFMGTVPVEAVATFYTSCPKCRKWVEFRRAPIVSDLVPAPMQRLTHADLERMGFRSVDNG